MPYANLPPKDLSSPERKVQTLNDTIDALDTLRLNSKFMGEEYQKAIEHAVTILRRLDTIKRLCGNMLGEIDKVAEPSDVSGQ